MHHTLSQITRAVGLSAFLPVLFSVETVLAATPTGLTLEKSTHQTIGGRGDNWTLTWARDGSTLVTMDDGNWFSATANTYSHAVYRIKYPSSTSTNFTMSNVSRLTTYPNFGFRQSCSFGYGLLAVDGIIYSMVSRCSGINWNQFYGMKLLKSYDNGSTWYRVDKNGGEAYMGAWDSARDSRDSSEYFFYKGQGVTHYDSVKGNVTYYPFVYNTFVQAGKDYQHGLQRDGYIYIYSPDPSHASRINLARVKHHDIGVRANWEYFTHYDSNRNPQWTKDINRRGVVYSLRKTDSAGNPISWYSGLPDVVYNAGLGKYIMVNGGMYAKTYNDTDAGRNNGSGSLTFYSSDNPYGPWKEFKHIDHFTATSSTERTYQPKLDPKNISSDGLQMNLIWSDHAGPFASKYYTFNQMKIKLSVDPTDGGTVTTPPPSNSGPVKVTTSNVEAEALSLSGYSVESGSSGSVIKVASSASGATGSASLIYGRSSGNYDINVRVLSETDGQSNLKLYVNGRYVATKTFPKVNSYVTLSFGNVALQSGDTIKVVGQKDGYATFARIDSLAFATAGGTSTPTPTPPTTGEGSASMAMEAEAMSLSGYKIEGNARVVVSSTAHNGTGAAGFTSKVKAGTYSVAVNVLAEDDGQPKVSLYVDGVYVGQQTFPRVVGYRTLTFNNVALKYGQTLKLVGQKDGYATFARINKVAIN